MEVFSYSIVSGNSVSLACREAKCIVNAHNNDDTILAADMVIRQVQRVANRRRTPTKCLSMAQGFSVMTNMR